MDSVPWYLMISGRDAHTNRAGAGTLLRRLLLDQQQNTRRRQRVFETAVGRCQWAARVVTWGSLFTKRRQSTRALYL